MVILFFVPGQVGFYFFLALFLTWVEVIALRLRSLAGGDPVGRTASAR